MALGRAVRTFAGWALAAGVAGVHVDAQVDAAGSSPAPIASPSAPSAASPPGWWWLADPAVVQRVDLDGKNPSVVFAYHEPESPVIASIAADPLHRRLFLAVEQAGPSLDVNEIARVGMDGRGYLRLRSTAVAIRNTVAYDAVEDRVYWIEGTSPSHLLRRMDASGANVATLLTLSLENVHDLEVDAVHRRLYWSQDENGTHAGSIYRANLDGSGVQMLYTALGTNALGGLGLDVPRGELYWVRSDGLLERGALDGSRKPETVLRGASVGRFPSALSVHRASGEVLWISAGDRSVRRLLRSGETGVIFQSTRPRRLDVENAAPPTAGSVVATGVTATSARLSAVVLAEGDTPLSARGIVVIRAGVALPAIGATGAVVLTAPPAPGSFVVEASGLVPGTTYAARAFATNADGTAYGPAATTFNTPRR